jgi:hypothetical protein
MSIPLLQEIKEWEHGYWQYIKYSWALTVWIHRSRIKRFFKFLKDHFDVLLRASFIGLALVIGLLFEIFGGTAFTQDILSNYLVAIGAMSGGIIAIVFTISIFLLQSAADLYSSQYFEVYIHDFREKLVYVFVTIITIIFFGAGLYVGSLEKVENITSSVIVWASLILIGVVFALIDWQYKTVRQKINPSKAIEFLEEQGVQFLDQVQADAKRIAKIIILRDKKVTENEALAKTYNHLLQPYINNLDRQLENLVEISTKLADKQEIATVNRGLTAFHNVLDKFLEVRKTSSVAIPSSTAFLAIESDSQKFIFSNFDRLNKIGEKFIKEGKDENATYILQIYDSLAKKAKVIEYLGHTGESPILETLIGCLENFIELGMRNKNLEVVFQGTEKLGSIAMDVAEIGLHPALKGIQDKVAKIAIYGITEKQTVIVDKCNDVYLRIIGASFSSKKIIARYQFDDALQHIATIAQYIFMARSAGILSSDFGSSFAMTRAYDNLYYLIVNIINYYPNLTDEREKDRYRSDISQFFEDLYMSLRKMSESLKNCDNLLVESIGRLMYNVNHLMVDLMQDPEFSDEKANLNKWLGWNIHLPSWFAHHADKFDAGSNDFRSLTENVAKTGMLASEKLQDKQLVKSAIDSLGSLTEHALNKNTDSYGYDEPRILEKACYLGILALKKGWKDIFEVVKAKIHDFEPKYENKYFSNIPSDIDPEKLSPRKDQLKIELMRWSDKFDHERLNGNFGIRDDAESMMYDLIKREDIDWFIYRVWGEWDAHSPINDAIEKEITEANEKDKTEKKNAPEGLEG